MKQPAVYILASERNGTLSTPALRRIRPAHSSAQDGVTKGFASRYGCTRLVHFELFADMSSAIAREKQIKAGSRKGSSR